MNKKPTKAEILKALRERNAEKLTKKKQKRKTS